jgi:hypothetical protein
VKEAVENETTDNPLLSWAGSPQNMSEDNEFNNIQVEELNIAAETRILTHRDLDATAIKRIAALALTGPDKNTDVGHAFTRRYGTKDMLAYLATIAPDTHIEIEESTIGLYFPRPNTDRSFAETVTLKSDKSKQAFLRKHADEMAFVSKRAILNIPIENLRLYLPQWIVAVNQITNSDHENLETEIETVISEQGWVVGLVAMAARGLSENEILKQFNKFEKEFGKKMPKRGWFDDKQRQNKLAGHITNIPTYNGVRLDYNTLNQIEQEMDIIHRLTPSSLLPYEDPSVIYETSPFEIKKGKLVVILPSEHEYNIREAVATWMRKGQIHEQLDKPEEKYIDRFITVYPVPKEVDFYPFEPFKYYTDVID